VNAVLGFLLSLSSVGGRRGADQANRLIERVRRGDGQAREDLLQQFTPLVLRVGSQVCGHYLQVGRDEEVSVGLIALNEAIDRFDPSRGTSFVSFAEVVIKRRLIDYYRRQKGQLEIPLSEFETEDSEGNPLQAAEYQAAVAQYAMDQESADRRQEIQRYSLRLAEFGIRFQDLVAASPKHRDARERALEAARVVAEDPDLARHLQTTGALPMKQLERRVGVSRKTLERQRKYIIAVALILMEDFRHLRSYITG